MNMPSGPEVIILAAGYATRLYPLTLTTPKPLLTVASRPILEHIVDDLATIEGISKIYIVGNEKFAPHFEEWLRNYSPSRPALTIEYVNDGSTNENDKRGAIGSLDLVLRNKNIANDVLVIAGDNLFGNSLKDFVRHAQSIEAPLIGAHDLGSPEKTQRFGMISIDKKNRVIEFIEKPETPTSSLIAVALYHYPKETLPLIEKYLAEGNNPDQPGRLIQWLYTKTPVFAQHVSDTWFDIGSKEMLDEADRVFRGRT
jgi:glucose-1-phosphate thymidylyltransferase